MVCIRKAEDPRAFPLMIDEEVCKHRILYSLGQGGPLECEHNRLNLHSLCKVLRIELATPKACVSCGRPFHDVTPANEGENPTPTPALNNHSIKRSLAQFIIRCANPSGANYLQ